MSFGNLRKLSMESNLRKKRVNLRKESKMSFGNLRKLSMESNLRKKRVNLRKERSVVIKSFYNFKDIRESEESMWIAQSIVWSFLKERTHFTLQDLRNEIEKKGGIWRIEPNYTVSEYISFLENIGALKRDLQGIYYPINEKNKLKTNLGIKY